MRMLNMNVVEDIEFLEFVMNSEMKLNLDKSIFQSKKTVCDFCNACSNILMDIGINVDGDIVVVMDWTLLQFCFYFFERWFWNVGDSFF